MTIDRLSDVVHAGATSHVAVAVWGAGREGRAALAELARRQLSAVLVVDHPTTDVAANELAHQFGLSLIGPDDVVSLAPSLVIRAPGISKYRPEIAEWARAGIACRGLTSLWLAEVDPSSVIAITGTKGKSTTSTLVALILEQAGHRVALGGNIGVPVTEMSTDVSVYVVEVSSYQAADCVTSPAIGVLTALGQDHVTWHQSVENYHADKLNLFAHSQLRTLVFHPDDPDVAGAASRLGRTSAPQHFRLVDDQLMDRAEVGIDVGELTVSVRRNLQLAANAACEFDSHVTIDHVAAALTRFEPLPSRQTRVATVNGVEWVDDALASNPLGVRAALRSFASNPLIMIMGGDDRGIDLAPLVTDLNQASSLCGIVLMGEDADPFVRAISTVDIPIVRVRSHHMAEAVSAASRFADELAVANDGEIDGEIVVSFSPGAPTPPAYGTWEDRSRAFCEAVRALPGSQRS